MKFPNAKKIVCHILHRHTYTMLNKFFLRVIQSFYQIFYFWKLNVTWYIFQKPLSKYNWLTKMHIGNIKKAADFLLILLSCKTMSKWFFEFAIWYIMYINIINFLQKYGVTNKNNFFSLSCLDVLLILVCDNSLLLSFTTCLLYVIKIITMKITAGQWT